MTKNWKIAKIWERPEETGIFKTECFIGNTSKGAQGHEIGRKLKEKCLLFRWLKSQVTWTLLLPLVPHILLLHHNKAAWMNEDQTAHFFFSGSTERGLHTTVVPPQRLRDSFIPRQVHWGDGVQGRRLLSCGLKRWLRSIPGAEEQCGVESLCSPTTLGCSPPIPLERGIGREGNARSLASMYAAQSSSAPWVTSPRANLVTA